ncbi:uridine kinase family protein [Luteimicrobium subarcticum]|uniref:Uridine kinase n=1 Tax=Luteimicrobium subarcticum TaxID=620910 RepID=A0A2M8WVY1_9MICO|nr:ATP-binding protein [Luteimicrobium subarcticum]PJI95073.1 uridine kinase [Luteimicrobium subarcticum]
MAPTDDLPPAAPATRVVLLTGASGSGKTSLTRRLGLPVVPLDDFYRDEDAPGLPRRFGIVDWDDPASWDGTAALATLHTLCTTGRADVPVYDIATSRRTGTTHLDVTGAPLVVAEGIFAAELVGPCRDAGLLGDAICLTRPRLQTFWYRLLRDLSEMRKPPWTLVRRGIGLLRDEPRLVAGWTAKGCRPLHPDAAERAVRALLP